MNHRHSELSFRQGLRRRLVAALFAMALVMAEADGRMGVMRQPVPVILRVPAQPMIPPRLHRTPLYRKYQNEK